MRICILEFSRVPLYEFHYDYIKNNKSRLLFTDTERMVYEIETENVYGDFSKNKEMFKMNNYSIK